MVIMDVRYCNGCVKVFDECTCEPLKQNTGSKSGNHLLPPTSIKR